MKILLVNDGPVGSGGGTEAHIRSLYKAFTEYGHTPYVLAGQVREKPSFFSGDTWLIADFNAPPLRKHPVQNIRNFRRALRVARELIRDIQPDVIHVHNMLHPSTLRMLRQLGPVVKSIHDCRPFCSKPPPFVATRLIGNTSVFCSRILGARCWRRCYIKRSFKALIEASGYFPHNLAAVKQVVKCQKIVVYSRYLKDLAQTKAHKANQVHLVYHFADVETIEERQQTFPLEKRLLFVGRLSFEKGIFHLLEAITKIPFDFETVIIGDGPMMPQLQRATQSTNGKRFRILGALPHDAMPSAYRAATLLVFPSIGSEGCPLVGIEALASGRPVVGFDVGGVREWLVHGETGFLVDRGDVVQLKNRIQELLSDQETAARMGRQGIALVKRKFRKDFHISRLLSIYADAIRERRASQ